MVARYLNTDAVWKALEVPRTIPSFELSSDAVGDAFNLAGDIGRRMQSEVQYLLANQVDVLIYQG